MVVATLFWPAIQGQGIFFERDVLAYWYPQIESFVRAVAGEGVPPLWSPYFAFGQPMAEDPSYQVFYPATWLNLIVPPHVYYSGFVVSHSLLAAFGLCRLARRFGLAPLPALAAAAVWTASGPFLSAANLHHHFAGLAWTPWVLSALDRVLARGAVGDGLVLGVVAGVQALAGSGDVCLMTGVLGLAGIARGIAATPERRAWRRMAGVLLLASIVALGVSAAQTLPALGQLQSAPRLELVPAINMYWSLHPFSLLDLFVDRVVSGFPMGPDLRAELFESRGPFLASLYLGLPAALLVLLGLLTRGRRDLAVWLFAGWAALLLAALGRHTPLYPLLLELPLVGVFRYPVKAMLVSSLLWALLAGFGVAAWQREWSRSDRRRAATLAGGMLLAAATLLVGLWVTRGPPGLSRFVHPADGSDLSATVQKCQTASALLLAAALLIAARARGPLPPPALTAVLLLVLVGDLVVAGRTVNPLGPPALARHRPPALEALGLEPERARVLSMGSVAGNDPARGPSGWERSWAAALGAVESLRPPSGARWGVRGSFDGDFTGLAPRAQGALSRLLIRQRQTPLAGRLLAMGNVSHVITSGPAPFQGLEPPAEYASVFAEPLRVFRVRDPPLPVAYWVGGARFASTDAEAYAVLADPAFDPRHQVILTAGSPRQASAPGAGRESRVLERRSDRLRLEVSPGAPGFLVVVEAFAPGWRATLDGAPTPLLKANLLFRAVAVPAGRHVVEMRYRPRSVLLGVSLSALTLFALAGSRLAASVRLRRVLG